MSEGKATVQIGRYQILEIIGTGANGRVARAFDPMIGRLVAIKLLSPELARGAARDKFIQEARVVGQISHPAIVTLHDMGIDESTQTPYLVMEFMQGQALDRVLEKGSVPLPRACAWAGDVASALAVAHRKGVIHGDVKPANILILEDNHVKLTDFGMARLASHDKGDSPLLGTPAYWCPEQILGKSHSSKPLPPSHSNTSVPAGFDTVLARCLEKDPSARYASADLLAADLYPFARRKTTAQSAQQPATVGLRDRASRLLRSA